MVLILFLCKALHLVRLKYVNFWQDLGVLWRPFSYANRYIPSVAIVRLWPCIWLLWRPLHCGSPCGFRFFVLDRSRSGNRHSRAGSNPFSLSIHVTESFQCPVRSISGHSNSGITGIYFAPLLDCIYRGLFRRESRQSKNSYIRRLQNRPRSTRAHVCVRGQAHVRVYAGTYAQARHVCAAFAGVTHVQVTKYHTHFARFVHRAWKTGVFWCFNPGF